MNPILPGFCPDPSVCRVGEDYYVVTSSFEYFPGVPIFHSRDLVAWRQLGHVLTRDSQLPLEHAQSSQGIFAPTLRHHAGIFYMITTNMSLGQSFYVTSRSAHGPWSEPIWIDDQGFGMDPSLFFDDDGTVYYTRHGGGRGGGVYQSELDLTSGRLLAPPRLIWSGTGGIWPEGPHLYKVGGTYYLLIAEGGTSYDHEITIARARSPWGPFEACPDNPIFTHKHDRSLAIQAVGHADLVEGGDGRWWMVCLGIRPWDGEHHHLGRETFLAPVRWTAAGWPEINGGRPLAVDCSDPHVNRSIVDDFAEPALGVVWNFVRNPRPGSWSLTARPGWLRLRGGTLGLDDRAAFSFLGQRQRHYRCRVSTKLDFVPRTGEQQAGLVVRADELNHYEIVVSVLGNSRQAVLRSRVGGELELGSPVPLASGASVLEVMAYPDRYEFFIQDARQRRHALGSRPSQPLSSEATGGFTGVYLGMYASGEGASADFDWFEYEPEPPV